MCGRPPPNKKTTQKKLKNPWTCGFRVTRSQPDSIVYKTHLIQLLFELSNKNIQDIALKKKKKKKNC